ncbi:MAG: ParB/RepB/Spo0J family partition protein [Legionella sp.]
MNAKRGGLGRNLSALLSHADHSMHSINNEAIKDHVISLTIDSLQPGKYQPRGEMDEEALHELAESIKKQGLLQPLVVRKITSDQYEIIAGERRWRASRIAGLTDVPVVLKQVDDETAMAIGLVENLQREDLNAMDQARAMQRLTTEFALTHQEVADLVSKSRAAVSNYLRLLNLNVTVRAMLENGDLDMGHARSLLMLNDAQQTEVAQLIVAKNLSVRETEALVARVRLGRGLVAAQQQTTPTIADQRLQRLAEQLQTKVKIKPGKGEKGSLVIEYQDHLTLEKLIASLLGTSEC